MAPKAPTSQNEMIQSKLNNLPQQPESMKSRPSSKVLVLGCLIYFTYSVSIAVDSQFLSLYYKSKGFDGATLGVLYSITPFTTFLTIPIWAMLTTGKGNEQKCKSSSKDITTQSFQILCMNIVVATMGQISLAILDKPIFMVIAITVVGMFQSPAKPMLDGILMDCLDDSSNFGRVRFFSILGSGVGTSLGGRLLAMVQNSTSLTNPLLTGIDNENIGTSYFWTFVPKMLSGFNLLFLARFILTIPPLICIKRLHAEARVKVEDRTIYTSNDTKKTVPENTSDPFPEKVKRESISIVSVTRDVAKHCFGDRNHLLFFLCIYIAGFSGGVSDVFSYPRYQESGCSTIHMGQSRLLSSCAGAVMFWFSGRVTRHLGIQNVLLLSMVCAGVRFHLLKRMDHPYYVYLVDFIRGSTYGAFWSASTIYASEIGPQSLRGSILLLLNGIYNGIGRSTGAIMGGRFQAIFGTDTLFLSCARMNYASALLMCVWYNTNWKSMSRKENSPAETKKVK